MSSDEPSPSSATVSSVSYVDTTDHTAINNDQTTNKHELKITANEREVKAEDIQSNPKTLPEWFEREAVVDKSVKHATQGSSDGTHQRLHLEPTNPVPKSSHREAAATLDHLTSVTPMSRATTATPTNHAGMTPTPTAERAQEGMTPTPTAERAEESPVSILPTSPSIVSDEQKQRKLVLNKIRAADHEQAAVLKIQKLCRGFLTRRSLHRRTKSGSSSFRISADVTPR